MTQLQAARGTATSVFTDKNGWTHVQYHATRVVSFNSRHIVLRANGYQTATTKARMMQAANQFGLGYQVFQRNFEWFVRFAGKTVDFEDGMVLDRSAQGGVE